MKENLVVNNKDTNVLMSQNYRSDSCPLEIVKMFLKPAYLLSKQIFVLRTSNFRGAIDARQKHSIV